VNFFPSQTRVIQPDIIEKVLECKSAFAGKFIKYSGDYEIATFVQKGIYKNMHNDVSIEFELKGGSGEITIKTKP